MSIIYVDSYKQISTFPSSGLIAHYDPGDAASYPGSGTTVTDLTGGNDGTLTSVNYSASNGGVFSIPTGYISLANMQSHVQGVQAFSVAMFVNTTGGTASTGLFSINLGTDSAKDIFLALSGNEMFFQVNAVSDGGWFYARPAAGWCSLVAIFDGTQPAESRARVLPDA